VTGGRRMPGSGKQHASETGRRSVGVGRLDCRRRMKRSEIPMLCESADGKKDRQSKTSANSHGSLLLLLYSPDVILRDASHGTSVRPATVHGFGLAGGGMIGRVAGGRTVAGGVADGAADGGAEPGAGAFLLYGSL